MKHVFYILASITVLLIQACDNGTESTDAGGIQTNVTRGPVEVTVTATPSELEVGQPLTLEIKAMTREGVTITMPMAASNENGTVGNFHVLSDDSRPDIPLPGEASGRSWSQVMILDTFQAGSSELPAFTIAFRDDRADRPVEGTITTKSLPIEVQSLIGATGTAAELRAIRGQVEMIDPWPTWVWMAIGLGGLLLVGLVTMLVRGRGLQELSTLSPEEQARRDLASLEASGLLQQKQVQPFYFRLTDILRHYIEGRFGLQAPRSTTSEFLVEIGQSSVLDNVQQQSLGQFLQAADMVKFARHEPSQETGNQALSQARRFVEDTATPAETEEVQS